MGNNQTNQLYTKQAKSTQNKQNIIKVNITTNQKYGNQRLKDSFVIYCLYSDQEKVKNIFKEIEKQLNNKHHPKKIRMYGINDGSFTKEIYSSGPVNEYDIDGIGNGSITDYDKREITMKGLDIKIKIEYKHRVNGVVINCQYMNKLKSDNPLHCPIYYAMKQEYDFSENNYYHLLEFNHFSNEFESKPDCKYGQSCKAYIRLEINKEDKMEDKCHIKLFKHPPRNRNIKLSQNIDSLIINKNNKDNHSLYIPTKQDWDNYDEKDGHLTALISEVLHNGYKSDLCFECGADDDCKHSEYGILQIVDNKMGHIRHKQMGSPLNRAQMLSIILYTGCEANYALCSKQRSGDYKTWKWFDYCLYRGIERLASKETGLFSVYSGLGGVKLDVKEVKTGYFVTYTSTSWRKEVANTFMGGKEGMMIQIDKEYKNDFRIYCCDVSWISKFPDECEILFARSVGDWTANYNNFNCVVLDEGNGVQTVCLKKGKK